MDKTYIIPECIRIGRSDRTERLYALESASTTAIGKAARELAQVLNHDKGEYWTRTMPLALFTVLESFDRHASEAAAVGYLRQTRARAVGDDRHIAIGTELARQIFAKRGNHSEAHLTEMELAAMLALAAERGEGWRHESITVPVAG